MPRSNFFQDPRIINTVDIKKNNDSTKYIEVATRNEEKIREYKRILKDFEIVGKSIDIEEIQSTDPIKVATHKAKDAYRENGHNPILVEDVSLDIQGLGGRPGPFVKDFTEEVEMRRILSRDWLKGKNRAALARVIFAIFDGVQSYYWIGATEGEISPEPKGLNGFGFDDIFIPKGSNKTFAEMSGSEKDKFSMRRKALESFLLSPFEQRYPIFELPEPYSQELERVQIEKLQNKKATRFAFALEPIEDNNKINNKFVAQNYSPITFESNNYFTRFLPKKGSRSLGLMLTDVDRGKLKMYKNGNPVIWQMGPERRHLALAQRAEFFINNQSKEVHSVLDNLDKNAAKFPKRSNSRSMTVEKALGISGSSGVTTAISLKEIGYKKLSSEKLVSRSKSSKSGLFNIVGKYARSYYAVGSLPFTSGWRDVVVMSAIGHMLVFVHRNNINAIDFQNQVDLIKDSRDQIKRLNLGSSAEKRALRNIGAALGCNPVEDLKKAKVLYKEAGVRAFRIYTINSDPRVVQTAKALRDEFGDEIEIFVGQLVDKKQCIKLISPEIRVDGFIFGHGGGRQCTSAINGMALSTMEELYQILTDPLFNNVSILVEGGLGSYVGGMLILGVDCILRNAQFANCIIEQGDIFFEHKNGEICHPYHGSASAPTMIIESFNKENAEQRLFFSGRTKNVEGSSGYTFYKERANSMSFYVEEFKHYAARTLADLGVESIWELREFLSSYHEDLLRIMTPEAIHTGTAYKS